MDLRTVTTSATGTARAVPDVVAVVLTIDVEGSTPAEALRACGAVQSAVVAALGVTASAKALAVQPVWDHDHQREGRPHATSTVTAQLPDLAAAGEVVTAALEAGGRAVRLQSLQPVVSDDSGPRAQARERAFAAARRAAEQYAALAAGRLGGLVHLSEGRHAEVPHADVGRVAVRVASYEVAEGGQDVVVSLLTTWELRAD
ncbi:MAG: hypothetical protein JWN87_504 [Frankiales bacterium]|nr:hypothetical protein [Frankiales bacterium]